MPDPDRDFRIEPLSEQHPLRSEALRLLLTPGETDHQRADRGVRDYLDGVERQGLDAEPAAAAVANEQVLATAWILAAPGRTGMLMFGLHPGTKPADRILAPLFAQIKSAAFQRDLVVLQALVELDRPDAARALKQAGFAYLTELVYLNHHLASIGDPPTRDATVHWTAYRPQSEAQFLRVLHESYQDSLDCPELTGLRDPLDILIGHRHTGFHDPALWQLATVDDAPVGLVFNSNVGGGTMELVYLGVSRDWRGKGVGDSLVHRSLHLARQHRAGSLALAVDVRNTPARQLYARWGFEETGRRRAWIAAGAVESQPA